MARNLIERDVLALDFDGREFQKGIQSSLRDLSTFKKSLDLNSAVRNISNLENAASRVSFDKMGVGIATITSRS